MKSRADSPRDPQPLPLRTSEQLKVGLRTSEPETVVLGKAEQLAAELLNDAFDRAQLENKEIAHLCGVSVSLVEKWRSREARGCPSFVQMLLLPPSFHIALHRSMNERFGFARQALRDLLESAGTLAMVLEK
jgi:DNA-binding transcriptional regulator YiaG